MPEDFSKNLIKEYKYWELYINANQNYLGKCVIWCKRENAIDLADATPEEQSELFLILNELQEALKEVFRADWFNYLFLGNVMRHLHCHFMPRYSKPQTFMGITFTDELYGQYPDDSNDNNVAVSQEVLYAMRDKLANVLKK